MSDVVLCKIGNHLVPREQITHIDTPAGIRACCVACKNAEIDKRKPEAKKG